jgi:hypothetical protein
MAVTGVWDVTSKMTGVQTTYRTDTFTDVKRIALYAKAFSVYYVLGLYEAK